jgi:2-succinyl-6-hydroxy-2,4-cyclohexadiene-1-carboxylate synthase
MLFLHTFAKTNNKRILFIHGLLGSTSDFLPLIKLLSKHFDCLSIDLPGHGKALWTEQLSKQALLEELSQIVIRHQISFIIGYSLGGRLAMELDFLRPHLTQKLVIISSHPGLLKEEFFLRSQQIHHVQKLLEHSPKAFLNYWYNQPLFNTLSKKKMLKKRKHLNASAVKWMLEEVSLLKQPDLWLHLNLSSSKYFFICGKNDTYYRKLYSALSQKKVIQDCSHAVHLEKPQRCYQVILKHLIKSKGL